MGSTYSDSDLLSPVTYHTYVHTSPPCESGALLCFSITFLAGGIVAGFHRFRDNQLRCLSYLSITSWRVGRLLQHRFNGDSMHSIRLKPWPLAIFRACKYNVVGASCGRFFTSFLL